MQNWEFQFWVDYRTRRGSLNFGLRIDEALAELKLMFAQSNGATDIDIWDFLPNHDAPDLTFDDAYEKYADED